MNLIEINNKLLTYLGKLVSAYWWILESGYWDDRGVWMDSETWRDDI